MDDQPIHKMEECFDGSVDFRNADGFFGRMCERSVARPKIAGWNAEFLQCSAFTPTRHFGRFRDMPKRLAKRCNGGLCQGLRHVRGECRPVARYRE